MENKLKVTIVLLFLTTISKAQVSDTTICYGYQELRYISSSLISARSCDTLLINANKKIAKYDTLCNEKDYEISKLEAIGDVNIAIIKEREKTIEEKNAQIKKSERKIRWLKTGWIASVCALTGTTFYFLFN